MPATVALSPAQPEVVESSLDVNLGTGMLCDGSVTVMLCVLGKSKCTRAWPPRADASDPGRYPGKRCLAPAEHLSLCVQREATSGRQTGGPHTSPHRHIATLCNKKFPGAQAEATGSENSAGPRL